MFFKATLTQKEVTPPENGWCDCGHRAPETFKRSGANSPKEPTKFFKLTSDNGKCNGVYCEPCLVIAHYISKKGK